MTTSDRSPAPIPGDPNYLPPGYLPLTRDNVEAEFERHRLSRLAFRPELEKVQHDPEEWDRALNELGPGVT